MKGNHNNQKKIAAINDLSGFGGCSMTVLLPIIAHMGIQCCPVITSIFSNHSGYDEYFFDDYTDKMGPYTEQWKKLGLEFDGIYTGFLGSAKQIDIVCRFIDDFRSAGTTVIVDPVMGDDGTAYSTYTGQMCRKMKMLVQKADLVTPNVTEACILTDTEYGTGDFTQRQILAMARKIASYGPSGVVITGIRSGSMYISNFIYRKMRDQESYKLLRTRITGTTRCGTGDVFASILAADAVNKTDLETSVRKAAAFIKKCINRAVELNVPETDGVCVEEMLYCLK